MKNIQNELKSMFEITNNMSVPRLEKVVVSAGIGSVKDKKKRELVFDRIGKITGQKPVWSKAKKSISNFKVRKGDAIGIKATLRGEKMYNFVDKLINIAIPRMRDFQGIPKASVDAMGNITIGIREHTIFPETQDEDLKDVFGFSVVITTTANNQETAYRFLSTTGFPLIKSEKDEK